MDNLKTNRDVIVSLSFSSPPPPFYFFNIEIHWWSSPLPAQPNSVHPKSLGATAHPVGGEIVALVRGHPIVGGEAGVEGVAGGGEHWGHLEGVQLRQLGALSHWVRHGTRHGAGGVHLEPGTGNGSCVCTTKNNPFVAVIYIRVCCCFFFCPKAMLLFSNTQPCLPL